MIRTSMDSSKSGNTCSNGTSISRNLYMKLCRKIINSRSTCRCFTVLTLKVLLKTILNYLKSIRDSLGNMLRLRVFRWLSNSSRNLFRISTRDLSRIWCSNSKYRTCHFKIRIFQLILNIIYQVPPQISESISRRNLWRILMSPNFKTSKSSRKIS